MKAEDWISVKERLPSTSHNVLCWLGDVILMGSYHADNDAKQKWAFFFSDNGKQYDEYWQEYLLTHWMPLPEPPKSGKRI